MTVGTKDSELTSPTARGRLLQVAETTSGTASSRSVWLAFLAGMGILVLLLVWASGNNYWLNILILTYLFGGLAAAWNLIGGFGGQLSLGHGVYFAIGAYSVAILYTHHNWSPWIALLVAIPIGVLVAAITSWPTFRLRGPFFAMATLALNEVALVLASYFTGFTGGPRGISIPFEPSLGNMMFVERWKYGLLMLIFVALAVAVTIVVGRSRLGYGLRAVREDDEAAAAAGLGILGLKMRGMLLSAALTTIGGALFAVYIGFVNPNSVLNLTDVSVRIALIVLLGGIGTISGPVVGALVLIPAMTLLQASLAGGRPGTSLIAVGILLVLIPLLLRSGLVGTAGKIVRRGLRWLGR